MTKKIPLKKWVEKYSSNRRLAKEVGVSYQTIINWCEYINSPYGRTLVGLYKVNERCVIEGKDLIDIDLLLEKTAKKKNENKK